MFQPVQKMADFYTAAIRRCRESRQTEGQPEFAAGRVEGEKGRPPRSAESDFGVEVEEGVERALELCFDLLARTLDDVHGDVGLMASGQLEGGVADFCNFAFGQEPQSIDKSQISHEDHLKERGRERTGRPAKMNKAEQN